MSPQDFCYLKDQTPLSQEGYENALRLRDTIGALIAEREAFIRNERLDPEIHLPMANWALGNGLYTCYETVMRGEYEVLNNLRLFAQIFTGFQLLSLSGGLGTTIPRAMPQDLDKRLAELVARNDRDSRL